VLSWVCVQAQRRPSRFKEGEAADGFGGIELAALQALKGLVWMLQLVVDHVDHLLEAPPQQGKAA
jgi:hypothetical protein